MPISGVGSTLAVGVETTWGTAVTTTRRYPFVSESLVDSPSRIEPTNLRAGGRLMTTSDWRPGITTVAGSTEMQLYDSGELMLFKAMMGAGGTTGAGPYVHEFNPTAALSSYTIQVAYGGDTSVPMKTFTGMVVSSWEMALEAGSEASLSLSWIGKDMATTNSGTPGGTYVSAPAMYTFIDGVVTYGGSSAGCVRSIRFAGDNAQDASRVCIGSSAPSQPIESARRTYNGTMDVEFETFAGAVAAATAGTEAELKLLLTVGASTSNLSIGANIRCDGGTPPVAGPDVVVASIPFTVTIPAAGDYAAKGMRIVATNGESAIG
jgi:hypothetical protein